MKTILFILLSFSCHAQLMIQRSWTKDYLAVVSASNTAGHTNPDYTQLKKQNRVVLRMHKNSIWTDFDVMWVFAQNGSEEFGRFNWKAPASFKLTNNNSVTWTSNTGVKSNGTTSYYETGWAPGTNGVQYQRNSAGFTIGIIDDIKEDGICFGVDGTTANTSRLVFNPENSSDQTHWAINNISLLDVAIATSNGIWQGYREVSTAVDLYRNQTSDIARAATSQSRTTRTLTICAFKSAPSDVVTNFCTRNISFLLIGNSLGGDVSLVKQNAIYDIMNDYYNSL